ANLRYVRRDDSAEAVNLLSGRFSNSKASRTIPRSRVQRAPKLSWKSYCRSKSDGHKLRDARSSMKIFVMIAVVALAVSSPVWSRADDQIRDASPDGKFAMSLKDIVDRGESRVKIELIEVS